MMLMLLSWNRAELHHLEYMLLIRRRPGGPVTVRFFNENLLDSGEHGWCEWQNRTVSVGFHCQGLRAQMRQLSGATLDAVSPAVLRGVDSAGRAVIAVIVAVMVADNEAELQRFATALQQALAFRRTSHRLSLGTITDTIVDLGNGWLWLIAE